MEKNQKRYRMTADYHTHTVYSGEKGHAKGTIEGNVIGAIDAGLEEIAISDHGPGHRFYGLNRSKYGEIRREIERLRVKYPKIKIYFSVEANIIHRGNCLDVSSSEADEFDFIIAGYHYGIANAHCIPNWLESHFPLHLGRNSLMVKNTDMVVKALYDNNIRILTHPGDKGSFDIREIARACAETDTLMEISTWHKDLTVENIKIAAAEDVKFVISSDAHCPERVGSFSGGIRRAIDAGLDMSRIVNIEEI